MLLSFSELVVSRALGITESDRTRWEQGRIIPTQVLQLYYDEGLEFVPEAPIVPMRISTFLEKLEKVAINHENPAARRMAEVVRLDVATAVYGFDQAGRPDPRSKPKIRIIANSKPSTTKGRK